MKTKNDLRRLAIQVREREAAAAAPDAAYRLAGYFVAGPLATWDHDRMPMIAAYWPFGTEFDVRPLMQMLVAYGYSVALPITMSDDPVLMFRRWEPLMTLEPDALGMHGPPRSAQIAEPDIVVVPTMAFDAKGNRLGSGKGCYDATLRSLRAVRPVIAAAVAYAGQEIDEIPVESHDERMDWVVTQNDARKIDR